MEVRAFQPDDERAVLALWERCDLLRPWNDPREDIRRKHEVQPGLLLVGVEDGKVVAVVMAGYEGRRGWVNYLGVDPAYRGRGFGREIMSEAEKRLRSLGCPKVNLQIRATNRAVVDFYARLGYAVEELVSMGKRLKAPEDG